MKKLVVVLLVLVMLGSFLTACSARGRPSVVTCKISWARLDHGFSTGACSNPVYKLTFEVENTGLVPIYDVEVDYTWTSGLPPAPKDTKVYKLSAWASPGLWSCDAVSAVATQKSAPCVDTFRVHKTPITRLRFYTTEAPMKAGHKQSFVLLMNPDQGIVRGPFSFNVECTGEFNKAKVTSKSPKYTLKGPASQQAPAPTATSPPPTATPVAETCIRATFVGDPDRVAQPLETLGQFMSDRLGCPVEFSVVPETSGLITSLEAGYTDMAMLTLPDYLQLEQSLDLEPLVIPAREAAGAYHWAAFVVRTDSGIETLDDLRGTSFAYTWEGSTYGYLLPRLMLAEEGYDPNDFFGETVFVGESVVNALWAVVNGGVDGASVWEDGRGDARVLVEEEFAGIWDETKIIARTPAVPWTVIAIQPYVPAALREEMQIALSELSVDATGWQALYDSYRIVELLEPGEPFLEAIERLRYVQALE